VEPVHRDQLGKLSEVLGCGGEVELVARAAGAPQSKAAETQA
jgi:hypothetical protein